MSRPRYRDLPDGCAWELQGARLGALELLTPERVVEAAQLVRTGRRFPLDLPLDEPSPPFFSREAFRHEVFSLAGDHVIDDKLDNFYPQASTQWDAFGHFAHPERGFHGGASVDEARAGAVGIEAWAEQGIAGRGVLLDVARHAAAAGDAIEPDSSTVITAELLDATSRDHGVELRTGDILCVRTGWIGWYRGQGEGPRTQIAEVSRTGRLRTPGLGPGPAIAEFLWDNGVVAIACDNPGVEPFPFQGEAKDCVHALVLAFLGIPLGEFFDFDALADDCAAAGTYEFLFTSTPMHLRGGIGSPPNALAIR
ncbi:MAG: cyclase family protein [Acidimicrobiia bacterium]